MIGTIVDEGIRTLDLLSYLKKETISEIDLTKGKTEIINTTIEKEFGRVDRYGSASESNNLGKAVARFNTFQNIKLKQWKKDNTDFITWLEDAEWSLKIIEPHRENWKNYIIPKLPEEARKLAQRILRSEPSYGYDKFRKLMITQMMEEVIGGKIEEKFRRLKYRKDIKVRQFINEVQTVCKMKNSSITEKQLREEILRRLPEEIELVIKNIEKSGSLRDIKMHLEYMQRLDNLKKKSTQI